MIIGKLDLSKITGAKVLKKDGRTFIEITSCGLFEGKNGAQYLDVALFDTPEDKYGNDWRICQSVSQEARQRGEKGPILGNGKNKGQAQRGASQSPMPSPAQRDSDEPPF